MSFILPVKNMKSIITTSMIRSYSGGRVKASELIDLLKLCPPDRQVVVELKSGKDVFHTVTGIACNKKDIILRYHPKRKRR